MTLTTFLFYVLAVLTGASAIAVVVTQNIVRAAVWLLFALAGTAGVFFLLGADFVGATQLLVYVGGTLVLVVFGVMLTAQGPFIKMKIGAAEWLIALVTAMLLYGVLAISLLTFKSPSKGELSAAQMERTTPGKLLPSVQLGQSLLGFTEATPEKDLTNLTRLDEGQAVRRPRQPMAYLLLFEVVSVHLLVVLIGAAYLARAKRRRTNTTPAGLPGR